MAVVNDHPVSHPRTLVPDAGSPWQTCPSSQTFQRVAAPAGGFGQLVMRIVVRIRMMMGEFITILVMVKMVMVKMMQSPICHLLWRLHNQLSCLCNW